MVKVSIGMPVYNGEDYIEAALQSLQSQTYEDLEIIVSDNGSTDRTHEIVSDVASMDKRLKVNRFRENMGASTNYNTVFELSSGAYFKWAAHDDLVKPTYIERCVDRYRSTKDTVSIVYPNSEFIDEEGNVTGPDGEDQTTLSAIATVRAIRVLRTQGMAAAVFGLFNSDVLRRTSLIGNFSSSDYVLLLQVSLLGRIIKLDGEPLFQRRVHEKMSRVANQTPDEVLKWFDPKAHSKLSERQRLYLEYAKAPYVVKGVDPVTRVLNGSAIFSWAAMRYAESKWNRLRKVSRPL